MPRRQINVRIEDDEMYLYLVGMENYSTYVRELITKDRIAQRDPKVIEAKLHDLEKQIRDLRQVQTKAKDQLSDVDILRKYNKIGKDQGIFEGDSSLIYKWVQAHVLPDLRKAGYVKYDPHLIIDKFIELDKKEEEE